MRAAGCASGRRAQWHARARAGRQCAGGVQVGGMRGGGEVAQQGGGGARACAVCAHACGRMRVRSIVAGRHKSTEVQARSRRAVRQVRACGAQHAGSACRWQCVRSRVAVRRWRKAVAGSAGACVVRSSRGACRCKVRCGSTERKCAVAVAGCGVGSGGACGAAARRRGSA